LKLLKTFIDDLLKSIRVHKRNTEVPFYQLGQDIPICADFVVEIEPIQDTVQDETIPLLFKTTCVFHLGEFVGVGNLSELPVHIDAICFNNFPVWSVLVSIVLITEFDCIYKYFLYCLPFMLEEISSLIEFYKELLCVL
jgi:hypothetical protein